jgi:tetratricopeptide (TPR) repeat protein
MRAFFDNLFAKRLRRRNFAKAPESGTVPGPGHIIPMQKLGGLFTKGDVVGGILEIQAALGAGGFGVVYLAYDRQTRKCYAIKTFRDELLTNTSAREAFKREALLWVNLEEHPFILVARWVTEISGRLFVAMDYVAPDAQGRVSLADHLALSGVPLVEEQALEWGIQFCLGMEHVRACGIRCHGDIKPANILITKEATLKITDFGLAVVAETAWRGAASQRGSQVTQVSENGSGFSVVPAVGGVRCGTPGYMPPEVYRGETPDVRGDIYSFGLVLWQMAAGSPVPPFRFPRNGDIENVLHSVYKQQMIGRVPPVDGPLRPVVWRCLRPELAQRYQDFTELRADLARSFWQRTGRAVQVSGSGERSVVFWMSKGASLDSLGRREEALACYEKALALDPRDSLVWTNKGSALGSLGRRDEELTCYEAALALDPSATLAWVNKGSTLTDLGRHEEALTCYDAALALEPRYAGVWTNKGRTLFSLARYEEALACHDKALAVDRRFAPAWSNKGDALAALGRRSEAIACYEAALAVDPRDAIAWTNKGVALAALGRREEAITCFDQALKIDPRYADGWLRKAFNEDHLGKREEAARSYRRFIKLAPAMHATTVVAAAQQRLKELES